MDQKATNSSCQLVKSMGLLVVQRTFGSEDYPTIDLERTWFRNKTVKIF